MGNTIKGSQALSNGDVGISIFGTSGKASNNVALANTSDDLDGDCGETVFANNVFGTSSDPCIK
jgi:hypothetical protein